MCVSYVMEKEFHSNKLYNNYAHVLYYVNPSSCNVHTPFEHYHCKWVLILLYIIIHVGTFVNESYA